MFYCLKRVEGKRKEVQRLSDKKKSEENFTEAFSFPSKR